MFSMMRWFLGSKFLRSSPYLKPSVVHVYNEHLTPRPELLAPALPASLRNQRVAVDSCRCPLVNQHNYGKSAFLMGKLTINGHVQQLCYFTRGYFPGVMDTTFLGPKSNFHSDKPPVDPQWLQSNQDHKFSAGEMGNVNVCFCLLKHLETQVVAC